MRLIVPFPPGGSTDFLRVSSAPKLTEVWQQPVIIDNRPGAAGNIGVDIAAKAPADGYTMVVTSMSDAISMSYYRKLPYSLTGDLHGVSLFATQPNALSPHPACQRERCRSSWRSPRRSPASSPTLRPATAAHST